MEKKTKGMNRTSRTTYSAALRPPAYKYMETNYLSWCLHAVPF